MVSRQRLARRLGGTPSKSNWPEEYRYLYPQTAKKTFIWFTSTESALMFKLGFQYP